MAINTRRNSSIPTVTVVDSADRKDRMASCCCCVPEMVGVFAILLMHFFLGIFTAAASFLSLGYATDISDKVFLSVFGSLYTFVAIISALSVRAIRKENVVMTRRLSITFWILIVLLFIANIINFVYDCINVSGDVNYCVLINNENNNNSTSGEEDFKADCVHLVHANLTYEGLRIFGVGLISVYFAYVVFRFARNMKKEVIPFSIATNAVPKTPTYFVYSTQPPTSTNWVPPPTYSVNPAHPLPDDFNPDSKN